MWVPFQKEVYVCTECSSILKATHVENECEYVRANSNKK
jgi:hypothetical protein